MVYGYDIDYIPIEAEFVRDSNKSILFELADGVEVWIPKSLVRQQDNGQYTVQEWFLIKERIDY